MLTLEPIYDNDPCPRVVITLDAPAGAVSYTVTRSVDGRPVRDAVNRTAAVLVVTDYEAPPATPITYTVTWTLGGGVLQDETASTLLPSTREPGWVWLHDPLDPNTAIELPMEARSLRTLRFNRGGDLVWPLGQRDRVLLGGRKSDASAQLMLITHSEAETEQLHAVADATAVCIRTLPPVPLPRLAYLALGDLTMEPIDAQSDRAGKWSVWSMDATLVRPPSADVVVPVYTWNDFAADYEGLTWNDFAGMWSGLTWRDFARDPRPR